ncbi:MAG TPA: LuxR C-terminal-related transcriptional regulator [Thermoanaerobaculia bacterium]|jgi:DNA-binding CsgD family transcriptional regulator
MRIDAIRRLWERLRASGGHARVLDTDSFTESERAVGRMVLPLFADLESAKQTIADLTEKALAIDAILRLLPSPALVVDETARLFSSNEAAKALFGGPAIPLQVVELAARALEAGEERECSAVAHPRRSGATLRIVPAEVGERASSGPGVVFLVSPDGDAGVDAGELTQRLNLTPMQARVVALVARGLSNREVGEELGLSIETIRKHLAAAYQKTGVPNRAGVVALAYNARFGARPPLEM